MPEFSLDIPKPKTSIWDNTVPIITEKNVTRVYLNDEIQESFNYNELTFKLDTASEAETFYIYINTPGGLLDAAIMLVASLNETKAKTVAILSGMVASAGTIVALACKEVVARPHLSFMIHNYSGGLHGKGHELKAHQSFNDKELPRAFGQFYKGFLTEDEISKVIDGQDIWLNADEVTERVLNRNKQTMDYGTDEV